MHGIDLTCIGTLGSGGRAGGANHEQRCDRALERAMMGEPDISSCYRSQTDARAEVL